MNPGWVEATKSKKRAKVKFFLFSSSGNRVLLNDSSVNEIQTSGLQSSETTVNKNLTANWWSMEEVNVDGGKAWIWNHQGFLTLGTRRIIGWRNNTKLNPRQDSTSLFFLCERRQSIAKPKPSVDDGQNPQGGTLEWITITSKSCCNGRANLFSRDLRSPRSFTRRIRNYQHSSVGI